MTQKKTQKPSRARVLSKALEQLQNENNQIISRMHRLEAEANDRVGRALPTDQENVGQTINSMARDRGQDGARRHATPGGPNSTNDIFPPGTGPMQLVWSSNKGYSDELVVGWQGDSFHHFRTRTAAVTWLLGIAQRILANEQSER